MFTRIDEKLLVSAQIAVDDVAAAAAAGIVLIINNRPDGEAEDQPSGDAIAAAAAEQGLDYIAIPVTHAGFSQPQLSAMHAALASANGPVLAYCRSGTRSTFLWALAAAAHGGNADDIATKAAAAGYDILPVRAMVDTLSAGR